MACGAEERKAKAKPSEMKSLSMKWGGTTTTWGGGGENKDKYKWTNELTQIDIEFLLHYIFNFNINNT